MRDIFREFLRPQSPLWTEVKVFLSLCNSGGRSLPQEVQVSNIMNVRRGVKRLSRLKGDEDPSEIQALLQWIIERCEIAGALCLQRLKIGHQIHWICALLASIARIRQFCLEVLEITQKKIAKRKRDFGEDTGTPLDRGAFNKLRRTSAPQAPPESAISPVEAMTAATTTSPADTMDSGTTSVATINSTLSKTTLTESEEERLNELSSDIDSRKHGKRGEQTELDTSTAAEISRVKNHPYMVRLKADIKLMIEAHPDAAKKASLKKVYGIALKRSLNQPITEESIKKVCKLAMKKARTYCQ